jgi:hypothetical protein
VSFAGIHRAAQKGFIARSFLNTRNYPGGSASDVASLLLSFLYGGFLPGAPLGQRKSLKFCNFHEKYEKDYFNRTVEEICADTRADKEDNSSVTCV